MGCDFFYEGCLLDHKAQEDVVALARQFYDGEGMRVLVPQPEKAFSASIHYLKPRTGPRQRPRVAFTDHCCPFNFYGLLPYADWDEGFGHGQFVFHRCTADEMSYSHHRQGHLVTLDRLPREFGIGRNQKKDCDLPQMMISDGGYNRLSGGYEFALLLHLNTAALDAGSLDGRRQ